MWFGVALVLKRSVLGDQGSRGCPEEAPRFNPDEQLQVLGIGELTLTESFNSTQIPSISIYHAQERRLKGCKKGFNFAKASQCCHWQRKEKGQIPSPIMIHSVLPLHCSCDILLILVRDPNPNPKICAKRPPGPRAAPVGGEKGGPQARPGLPRRGGRPRRRLHLAEGASRNTNQIDVTYHRLGCGILQSASEKEPHANNHCGGPAMKLVYQMPNTRRTFRKSRNPCSLTAWTTRRSCWRRLRCREGGTAR